MNKQLTTDASRAMAERSTLRRNLGRLESAAKLLEDVTGDGLPEHAIRQLEEVEARLPDAVACVEKALSAAEARCWQEGVDA